MFFSWLKPKISTILPKGLFPETAELNMESTDPVFRRIFQPLFQQIAEKANMCHRLQTGQLHIYIMYIFIATALLLGVVLFPA
jgi:hypothetical protein